MENIKKFEPLGTVERLAIQVINKIRQETQRALNQRMYFSEFQKLSPIIDQAIEQDKGLPKGIRNSVRKFLAHILVIPKERRKYTEQIRSLVKKNGFSLNMDILLQKVEEIFRETENQLRNPNNTDGFLQIIDAHWESNKKQFLEIFGNHEIYHIAMTAYEKANKRHLPRKTEIQYENKIRNRQK